MLVVYYAMEVFSLWQGFHAESFSPLSLHFVRYCEAIFYALQKSFLEDECQICSSL